MNQSKLIVVAGANGKLGRLITQFVLAAPDTRVRLLVRDAARLETATFPADRTEVRSFDATTANADERAAAVAGAYAVVSALQGGPDVIIDAQLALLRAAKAAGARRFLSSAFSYDIFKLPAGVNVNSDWRRTLAEQARAEVTPDFEVVHVLQGIFADRYVLGFLGLLDGDAGVLRYWGDGHTPIDWTSWADTARFAAAAALDDRPVPEQLFVAGDRKSTFEFAALWQDGHGRPLTVERLGSLEELTAETGRRLAAEPTNLYAWLPLMYAQGVFSGEALLGPLHNGRYPEIHASTLSEAIATGDV